jgi:hypothetical protein
MMNRVTGSLANMVLKICTLTWSLVLDEMEMGERPLNALQGTYQMYLSISFWILRLGGKNDVRDVTAHIIIT